MAPIRYTRNLFLRGMCIVYLFAFTSLYIQIPGLYGNNGILPARTQLESKAKTLSARIQTKPTLLWLAPYVGLNTEYMMDVLALMGIFLAFTGFVSQKFCTAPVFGGLWSLYYSLYQVGQTFMWFQWDILLLEAGFLCILVAPFRYQLLSRRKAPYSSPKDAVTFWLVRWLLFRLMFSSGVVKLTSDCPTWWGLTALTVHFESQCIPTPLAWYAHHLPRWFLKLSTVFAQVTEVGIPHLFFFPLLSVRVVAFYIQLFLQVGIVLTGNYNFFNVLTIVLCVSLLEDEFFYTKKAHGSASSSWHWISKLICFGVYGAVLFATYKLYGLRVMPSYVVESDISFTKQDFNQALSYAVPLSVYVGVASFGIIVLDALFSSIRTTYGGFPKLITFSTTLLYSCAAAAVLGLSIVPYSELHPAGNSTVHPVLKHWHSRLSHLHVSNSYGLFRRMTGVGGRPEVIIEGSNSIDGPWSEYNFLYKPGNVNATPPFVAPHQPRLDWQMWFAALGTYHQNPWLMSLAYRLLQGQPEVLRLMDTSHSPFPSKPPKYIKASLYHYHYTPWSQRSSNTWWKREKVGEYFPIFSRDHPPLLDYLRNLRILSPEHEKTFVDTELLPWLKALLDQLRFLVSHVEATVLVWSLFTAGCAIIITAGTSPYSNSRRGYVPLKDSIMALLEDDFIEFMNYLLDDDLHENVPRLVPDYDNPLYKYSDVQFLKRFRFSKDTVVNHIMPVILQQPETNRGLPVPPVIRLTTALRFYATGSYQIVCGDLSKLSQASACRIIRDISERLARHLPNIVHFPQTEAGKSQVKIDFFNMRHFPNVIGCIDCTHIPIINPGGQNAEVYRNRKGWMSLNVQVVTGPQLQIFDIVIRWPGSTHDSRIFENSGVKVRLEDGDLRSSFLLGDGGYRQTKYLYTPVQDPQTLPEQRYNSALIPTRTSVERTFGVLKRRFPCLCQKLRNKLRTITRIIAACAVLHNIGRTWDPQDFPAEGNEHDWNNLVIEAPNVRETDRGRVIKQTFIQRHFGNAPN